MTTPTDRPRAYVERNFPTSVPACSMDPDTDTSRPGSRANDVPGLADQKDTDRLMDIESRTSDIRPAICPNCGGCADNGVRVRRDDTDTATLSYCCAEGHIFSVTWLEVA